jgi:hypothetical protein
MSSGFHDDRRGLHCPLQEHRMPAAFRRPEPMTIEAFDAFIEAQADDRTFELVEGQIVA